ncbi:hypothetical protein, partial [Vibrio vulnificus]|uniref:hypothetical protein n=1 Tax=Vibrio vulnificus TaxID=672 RepID=UPI001A7EC026
LLSPNLANRQHTYDQDLPTSGRIGQKIHLSNSIPFASFRCNLDNLANAALRGEQRKPPDLKHCAVNTKANSSQNCQAL